MSEKRRSGRNSNRMLSDVDDSSGPNSPSIDSFDDLSIDGFPNKKKGKSKQTTERALKQLMAKSDENSLFLADFDPTKGRKAKQKLSEKAYKESNLGIVGNTKTKNVKKDSLYDAKGALLQNGLDLCDCLIDDCPGCHFPCPRCKSTKCGHECRNNRKWVYDTVELDGIQNSIRENKYRVK